MSALPSASEWWQALRYEVRTIDRRTGVRRAVGWSDDRAGAEVLAIAFARVRGVYAAGVIDQAGKEKTWWVQG